MENASKALIIAGAILISILIIGLGVFIYNKAKGAMDDSINLDEQKIQSINSKFDAYEGTAVSASDVKALIDLIRTHNNQYTSAKITVTGGIDTAGNTTDKLTAIKGNVISSKSYTVKIVGYYDSGTYKGFIEKIDIK